MKAKPRQIEDEPGMVERFQRELSNLITRRGLITPETGVQPARARWAPFN